MKIFERINGDIKAAMLAREKDKLESLRAIKAALLLAKTAEGASDILSDETEIKIIRKMLNQRHESATIYKQQGREDLYNQEMLEAKYIEAYLPPMMSEEDLVKELKAIIQETGAQGLADLGKVMGIATKKLAGKTENKLIVQKVKELLQ